LTSDAGLLGLVIGFFGSILGLIQAFDSIESIGVEISAPLLAGGLKVSFITTVFGTLTFVISRIGLLILKGMHKA
jgi:biopolymer transport protein ExbB/TolQ